MELHKLVQSMTKPEKRFFRSYSKLSATSSKSKYLSLFEVLCKTELGNRKKIEKKGFTYDDKGLLMEKLLEALHLFHSRKSIDAEIQLLLSQINILYEKNIWGELNKQLQKAKKLAMDNERLLLLLQVMEIEQRLTFINGDIEGKRAFMEQRVEVANRLVEEMNYESELHRTRRITLWKSKVEKLEKFKELNSMLPDITESSTAFSKINYWGVKFVSEKADITGHRNIYAEKIFEIIQKQNFVLLNNSPDTFGMFLYMAVHLNNYANKKLNLMDLINSLPTKSNHILYSFYGFILDNSISHPNDKTEGEAAIHKIIEGGDIVKDSYLEIWMIYLIIVFYGTFGDWGKAENWFDKLSSIKRSTIRKNLQVKARIYSLVIHYELDNKDLDIQIQSVQRYLQRNDRYSDGEKYILNAFYQLFITNQHHEKIKIWKELHNFLSGNIKVNGIHTPVLEFKRWCKSKIEGDSTVAELLSKKEEQLS